MEVLDNSIVICPNEIKEKLIPSFNMNPNIRVKFLSREEIKEKLYYTYDDNAIVYLMNKGMSYSNAKEILDNLKGVVPGNDKLNNLVNICNELKEKNLLKKDYYFRKLFDGKNVYVIGYSTYDEELKHLLSNVLKLEYEFDEVEIGEYRPIVHEANSIEEEVDYLFDEICRLNREGVELNKIYLFDYPSDYDWIIKKYAKEYNLPIEFKNEMTLNDSPVFKGYLNILKEGHSIEESFDLLSSYSYDDFGAKEKLVKVLNDILNISVGSFDVEKFLIEKAKRTSLKKKRYDNSIKITSSSVKDDEHVFIVGFSSDNYPVAIKDTDYLNDKEKEMLHLNTSILENRINNETLARYVSNVKNVHIIRRKKNGKEEKYDTNTTKKLELSKEKIVRSNLRYNKALADIEVAKYNDEKIAFGTDNPYLNAIDLKDIRYREFDYSFKPSALFENDNYMKVSYSAINDYYECPFMYFIKRVCKLNVFEDTFYTKLGKVYHKILEDSLTKDIKLEDYQEYVDSMFVEPKEKLFIKLLLPQVEKVIEKNKFFKEHSDFTRSIGEQEIKMQIDNNTELMGFVDKIIFNDKDKEALIVDYKTSSISFNKDKVQYGLSLQLPTYGVLLEEKYPDYYQAGIYIQRVCVSKIDEKSYILEGITKEDDALFRRIDKGFDKNSDLVKGINETSKGHRKSGALISEEDYQNVINDAKKAILEAIKGIREGNFTISPTLYKEKESHCKDCPLGAVCFHTPSSYRRVGVVEEKKEEE